MGQEDCDDKINPPCSCFARINSKAPMCSHCLQSQ